MRAPDVAEMPLAEIALHLRVDRRHAAKIALRQLVIAHPANAKALAADYAAESER